MCPAFFKLTCSGLDEKVWFIPDLRAELKIPRRTQSRKLFFFFSVSLLGLPLDILPWNLHEQFCTLQKYWQFSTYVFSLSFRLKQLCFLQRSTYHLIYKSKCLILKYQKNTLHLSTKLSQYEDEEIFNDIESYPTIMCLGGNIHYVLINPVLYPRVSIQKMKWGFHLYHVWNSPLPWGSATVKLHLYPGDWAVIGN